MELTQIIEPFVDLFVANGLAGALMFWALWKLHEKDKRIDKLVDQNLEREVQSITAMTRVMDTLQRMEPKL